MKIDERVLSQLGPQERKVFDALLTHEYMSTAKIIQKTKLAKTGVPSVLAKLRQKGLIVSKRVAHRKHAHKACKERLIVPQDPLRTRKKLNGGAPLAPRTDTVLQQAIAAVKNLEYALEQIEQEMTELREFQERIQGLLKG